MGEEKKQGDLGKTDVGKQGGAGEIGKQGGLPGQGDFGKQGGMPGREGEYKEKEPQKP